MIDLLKLILAHFIGDFLLQPATWVVSKENRKIKSPYLYLHVLIHGALAALLIWNSNSLLYGIWTIILHFLIDLLKTYKQSPSSKTKWFLWDQALNLVSILLLWMAIDHPAIDWVSLWSNTRLWLYLTAFIFVTFASSVIIQVLMSGWTKDLDDSKGHTLLNAGKYIGLLERSLALIFVLVGHWEAVGFLLTAKSVFRFGDLKDAQNRKLTEYVLIGTLLSFGIAIVTGILVKRIL